MIKKAARNKKQSAPRHTSQRTSSGEGDHESSPELALKILLELDEWEQELSASVLSDPSKFHLPYILQGLINGNDPFLGLVTKADLKKGRTLFDQLRTSFGHEVLIRAPNSLSPKGAKDRQVSLQDLIHGKKGRPRKHLSGHKRIYAAMRRFPIKFQDEG